MWILIFVNHECVKRERGWSKVDDGLHHRPHRPHRHHDNEKFNGFYCSKSHRERKRSVSNSVLPSRTLIKERKWCQQRQIFSFFSHSSWDSLERSKLKRSHRVATKWSKFMVFFSLCRTRSLGFHSSMEFELKNEKRRSNRFLWNISTKFLFHALTNKFIDHCGKFDNQWNTTAENEDRPYSKRTLMVE